MQDFPERTDLGNGFSWTAQYKSWDWAHHGRFYFLIIIYQGDESITQLKVYVDDHAWGDPSCRQTEVELQEKIRAELHTLALAGESNTEYV
jgi:hypothetical protein